MVLTIKQKEEFEKILKELDKTQFSIDNICEKIKILVKENSDLKAKVKGLEDQLFEKENLGKGW